MKIENTIEFYYRELQNDLNDEFEMLYEFTSNDKLRAVFSTLHHSIVSLFYQLNSRLPTGDMTQHFWADGSRRLIKVIKTVNVLRERLENSELAFTVDNYYAKQLALCESFLNASGGSSIPPHTNEIELYYTNPIFIAQECIEVSYDFRISDLKPIGQGSYAKVFKYFDKFYQRNFALKRANRDLNAKELKRFSIEYQKMKELRSPYVVEVFGYNDTRNEYVMEFMDTSLKDYIDKNNSSLEFKNRKHLGLQILKGFQYLHKKDLLHRDVSPNNLLVKQYDDVAIVKIADFGLVKVADSCLTACNTKVKGSFNDPRLEIDGFGNYNVFHEIYALTRLLFYLLTGRTSLNKIPSNLKSFVERGINYNPSLRFKDVAELTQAFKDVRPD